jgi:O-antigen ligase
LNLERVQRGLVAAVAATCLVSIFAAEIFLALAAAVYLARLVRGSARLEHLPVDGPLLAFTVWSILSAAFAPDPLAAHRSVKQLVLFSLLYLAVDTLRDEEARERVVDVALLGGIVLAAGAIQQYCFLGFDTIQHRPRSFLGHYMTASGLVMGVLVVAAARLAFRRGPVPRPSPRDLRTLAIVMGALALLTLLQRADLFAVEAERLFVAALSAAAAAMVLSRGSWPDRNTGALLALLAVPVCTAALLLSLTRNAWLGTLAGLVTLAFLRAPKALWLLPAGAAALLVLGPARVIDRLTVTDASSRDRYYMWQAGVDMIRDKPVFGQGPRMIQVVYPAYRWPEAPNPVTPHLHNNALQIAAERGLPCLVWWLWLVAAVLGDAWREGHRGAFGPGWVAAAAFALLVAVLVAGLFEYNFGDSEILMFLLLVSSLPYALRRQRVPVAAAARA